jgi:hypothetical protein
MFVPKWLLAVLFLIAIGSTAGMLFMLAQRPIASNPNPSASATVFVKDTALPSASTLASASATPVALSSNAEWKKYTSTSLSIKLEYPANWNVSPDSDGSLLVGSPDETVGVLLSRSKKERSTQKLTDYLTSRAKEKNEFTLSDEKSMKIDTFDAASRVYTREGTSENRREIVFFTKNYIYTITIQPSSPSMNAVIEELLKTIEVI